MTALTEREQALVGNRANKTPGSTSWSWQTITALQFMWENLEICFDAYVRIWREAEDHAIWEKVPPDNPYGSKEAMLKALEVGDEEYANAKLSALAAEAIPLKPHGGDRRNGDQGAKGHLERGSNRARYLIARIARDHPEIHRRMMNGEFKTVAEAAREAGIYRPRQKSVGLISDIDRVAKNIRRHYTEEQVKALKDAL